MVSGWRERFCRSAYQPLPAVAAEASEEEESDDEEPSSPSRHGDRRASDGAASNASNTCLEGQVRVIEPVRTLQCVQTERTLASLVLGKGSDAEHVLFDLFVRRQVSTIILWSLWWLGLVAGLLPLLGVLRPVCCWASMLMLPLPLCAAAMLSADLVREVSVEFETYFNLYLVVYITIQAVQMLRDQRAVFWLCFFPSMFFASYVDAYPPKYRSAFAKQFFVGFIIVLIAWIAGLYFGWVALIHNHIVRAGAHGFEYSSAFATLSGATNLFFLCLRHCWVAFYRPDEFVVIISSVRTCHRRKAALVVDTGLELVGP